MKSPRTASHLIEADMKSVHRELTFIRAEMIAEAARSQSSLHKVHPNGASARNLLHYLGFRRHDHFTLIVRITLCRQSPR